MALTPAAHFTITPADTAALDAAVDGTEPRSGAWFNLLPRVVDNADIPDTPNALAIFSRRGPAVPLATIVAAHERRGRIEPTEIGVQHAAASRLAVAWTRPPPEGIVTLTDHPKRGWVAAVPPEMRAHAYTSWLCQQLIALCRVPHTGQIDVLRYEPKKSAT